MVPCPKCRTSNPDGSKFCKACRTPIPQTDKKLRCPNGHILDPSWRICPVCQAGALSGGGTPVQGHKKTVFESPGQNQPCVPDARRRTKVEGEVPIGRGTSPVPKGKRKTVVICQEGDGEEGVSVAKPRLVGFLVTFSHDSSGRYFEIREGRVVVGAGAGTDITVKEDKNMSSEHAILLYRRGIFFLRDNLSTNGTFVNGEEITTDVRLKNYDEMKMGDTVFKLIAIDPAVPATP